MSGRSRTSRLVAIAAAVAVTAIGLWTAGVVADIALLRFAGLMTGATTFVPLPADTFVLAAAPAHPALLIGVLGGAINTAMVLVERRWVLILVDHPAFDRFVSFFDGSRLVKLASRRMFLGLLIGGASFVPFEPFRLLAVLKGYSPLRYGLATFLARGGRYLVLASIGEALLEIGWLTQALWLSLALFLVALGRSVLKLVHHGKGPVDPVEPVEPVEPLETS